MYLEDTPIKKQEDDLLHRSNFAKRLGKSLLETNTKDGYCVGLFGPWGSGKSSVVNMVLQEIENISKDDEEKPIVMYFNPWNFSSSEQLLKQYFLMLANQFSTRKDKSLNAIGDEIQKYASMFDVFGDIGKAIGVSGQIISRLINHNNISNGADITKQKECIVKRLKEHKQKIIVVIDDIDRLSNQEIKLIFQLVNTVAKFPNTIYLLSFDKEIVARALTEVQQYDGEKYLEKIIQVPIEIPDVSNDYLWDALFLRLDEVIKNHNGIIYEEGYWGKIFSECVSIYIHNIRDVVRLVNALNIKADMIGEEVNFADLVAITIVEIKLPNLYRWIKENQTRLVGGEEEFFRFYGKNADEIKQYNIHELKNVVGNQAEDCFELLNVLFPYYASKTNSGTYYTDDLLRRKQRIGHSDIFKRYFALEVDEKSISREVFNYAITKMNEIDLELYIEQINKNSSILTFLKELSAAIDEISKERIPVIINALVNKAVTFDETESRYLFTISAFRMALYKIEDLLKKIDDEEKSFLLLVKLLSEANEDTISILVDLIESRELAYGRLAAAGKESGEKIVSLDQLIELEILFVKKIKEISKQNCLLDLYNSRMILYLYESLDEIGYKSYMKEVLLDDLNQLKYLGFFIEKWTSGSLISWRINVDYLKHLDEELIDLAITKCKEDSRIWNLSEENLHRVVAFMLWREKIVDWDGAVENSAVEERINIMKDEYIQMNMEKE